MRDGNCRHLNAVEKVALDLDEKHEPADYRKTGSNFNLPEHLFVQKRYNRGIRLSGRIKAFNRDLRSLQSSPEPLCICYPD